MKHEDRDVCRECGGFCCKKSGCDYSPKDFKDLSLNGVLNILECGNISIVSVVSFELLPNGKKCCTPFLFLRARNVDRDIVDIMSYRKQCSMLTETGCSYDLEHRPSGGSNLLPLGIDPDTGIPMCHPDEDPSTIVRPWESYQKVLTKAVKRLTGKTVEEVFVEQLEELFVTFLKQDFDGISPVEGFQVSLCLPDLIECYPEVYEKAKKRVNIGSPVLSLRP